MEMFSLLNSELHQTTTLKPLVFSDASTKIQDNFPKTESCCSNPHIVAILLTRLCSGKARGGWWAVLGAGEGGRILSRLLICCSQGKRA